MEGLVTETPLVVALECIIRGPLQTAPNCVIALVGLSGVGKSDSATYLHRAHGFSVLRSESVHMALFGRIGGMPQENYAYSAEVFRQTALRFAQTGHAIVLDSTNLRRVYRDQIRALFEGIAVVDFLHIVCEPELAFARASGRAGTTELLDPQTRMDRPTFDMLARMYEPPDEDEAATTIVSDHRHQERIDAYVDALSGRMRLET